MDNLDNSYAYARILNKEDEPETLLIKTVQVKEHVPGLSYFSNKTSSSSLNKVEQATCLKALELYQSGRVNLLPQEHIAMSTYQVLIGLFLALSLFAFVFAEVEGENK